MGAGGSDELYRIIAQNTLSCLRHFFVSGLFEASTDSWYKSMSNWDLIFENFHLDRGFLLNSWEHVDRVLKKRWRSQWKLLNISWYSMYHLKHFPIGGLNLNLTDVFLFFLLHNTRFINSKVEWNFQWIGYFYVISMGRSLLKCLDRRYYWNNRSNVYSNGWSVK